MQGTLDAQMTLVQKHEHPSKHHKTPCMKYTNAIQSCLGSYHTPSQQKQSLRTLSYCLLTPGVMVGNVKNCMTSTLQKIIAAIYTSCSNTTKRFDENPSDLAYSSLRIFHFDRAAKVNIYSCFALLKLLSNCFCA